MNPLANEHATPPDDGGHIGAHTQLEETLLGGDRDRDTESIESTGKTALRPSHPNRGLLWFWAAIAALSIGLVMLGRAYL